MTVTKLNNSYSMHTLCAISFIERSRTFRCRDYSQYPHNSLGSIRPSDADDYRSGCLTLLIYIKGLINLAYLIPYPRNLSQEK
jgi:hypothetical protein